MEPTQGMLTVSNAYAVVIGIENYQQPSIPGINYAHADANAMANVFEECLGVPHENVKVWLDKEASFARIASELKHDADQLDPDDRFYFFYAGHGFWSAEGGNRLTAWDTHPLNAEGTTVRIEDVLLKPLKKAACKTSALFIDACSTALTEKGASRDLLKDMSKDDFVIFSKGAKFLNAYFACSPGEKSWSSPTLKHGIWTYYLERALRGEEPGAIFKEKFVTHTGLQDYLVAVVKKFVREKMKKTTVQTPYAIFQHNGTAPLLTLPELPPPSGEPLLDPDFSEAYFVGYKTLGYKWLPTFNKKIHTVPTSHSESAANFARRLLSEKISEELQSIAENSRQILDLRYRDVKKDDDEAGSGTVDTDAFRFAIDADQSKRNHAETVVRREIRLRKQYAKLPEEFDSIFPGDVDTLVVPLRGTNGKFIELRDAIEDRGLEIEDANETTEVLRIRLSSGSTLKVDMQNGRMVMKIPGVSGALSLIEAFEAGGGAEISGPTPRLIGKPKPEE
jgi:hypothetical protein